LALKTGGQSFLSLKVAFFESSPFSRCAVCLQDQEKYIAKDEDDFSVMINGSY
jgi:uncharacterized protein YcbX